MKTPEQPRESEPRKEVFNRENCISYSLRTFAPMFLDTIAEGRDFSQRFLTREVQELPGRSNFHLPLVADSLDVRLQLLAAHSQTLTDQRLAELEAQAKHDWRSVGFAMRDKGRELRLVQTVPLADVVASVKDPRKVISDAETEDRFSTFNYKGWNIYDTPDGRFLLATPHQVDSSKPRVELLDTVTVDTLYSRDPEFIKEQTRKYHESNQFQHAINHVTYNLAMHGIPQEDIVPAVIRQLEQYDDPQLRTLKIKGLGAFLRVLDSISRGDMIDSIYIRIDNYLRGLNSQHVQIPGDDRSIYLDGYLQHKTFCPGESPDNRERTGRLYYGYQDFVRTVNPGTTPDMLESDLSVSRQDKAILQRPFTYTKTYLEEIERDTQAERDADRQFVQFLQGAALVREQASVLRLLEQDAPAVHSKLEGFQEWIGKQTLDSHGDQTTFDRLIEESARNVRWSFYTNPTLELEGLENSIAKGLSTVALYGTRHNNEWIYSPSYGAMKMDIIDSRLRDTLSVFVEKFIQNRYTDGSYPIVYDESQQLAGITTKLQEKYQANIQRSDQNLQDIVQKRKAMAVFLEKTGITEDAINAIVDMSRVTDDDLLGYKHSQITLLVDSLYLAKKGVIDPKSPEFRSLMLDIFNDIKPEILDKLAQLS